MSKTQIDIPELHQALEARFQALEDKINGHKNSPLHQKRQEAMQHFKHLGFPNTKHEEWKYTNVNKILKNAYNFDSISELKAEDTQTLRLPEMEANVLFFVNGVFRKDLSHIVSNEKQLLIQDLGEAYQANPALVDQHFARFGNTEQEAFTALNTAFAEQGLFLRVPDGQVVEAPVVLHFISDARQENVAVQPRCLFVVGKNSQLSLIDKIDTLGTHHSFNNAVTEIVVQEDAYVTHCKIQNDQAQSYYIGTTQIYQAKQSTYTNTTISLNGGLIRNNLNITLDGEHIESNMYGLYMLKGKTHVDNHSVADHRQPHAVSNELYKGILDDQSTGVFNGKIYVRQAAQKTNAYQQNRNILLTDQASINTKPQLEIWADDVKCSHGATTGSLDEQALFYLRSRGIVASEARALLIFAFGNEIIEKITVESVREYLANIVAQRLRK